MVVVDKMQAAASLQFRRYAMIHLRSAIILAAVAFGCIVVLILVGAMPPPSSPEFYLWYAIGGSIPIWVMSLLAYWAAVFGKHKRPVLAAAVVAVALAAVILGVFSVTR